MISSFSIIIPIFNGEKTIERLLGTIIAQREYICEVIVCNDKSTDNTVEICEKYEDILPLKIITTPEDLDRSPGNARQCGVDIAKGDWLVFADADDMFPLNAFFIYSGIIENHKDIKMIIGAFDEVHDGFNIGAHYVAAMPWVHGKCFNTQFIKEHNIRFPKEMFSHEDKYFVMRTTNTLKAEKQDALVSELTTYFWMLREDSIVHSENYVLHCFDEAANALIEPWEICQKEYDLNYVSMRRLFGDDPFSMVFDMYSKIQCYHYRFGEGIAAGTPYLAFLHHYKRIKELFKITGQDIINYAMSNPDALQARRSDSLRTMGNYVDSQTFQQFIEEAERAS